MFRIATTPASSNRRYRRPSWRNRRSALTMGTAALAALVLGEATGTAATINVTTTDMRIANDGFCSLTEAIQALNTQRAVWSCPAGTGTSSSPDVITLRTGIGEYELVDRVDIQRSAIIRSATRYDRVVLRKHVDATYPEMIFVDHVNAGALTVRFEDLYLLGFDNGVRTAGVFALGGDPNDKVTISRCRVADFTFGGLVIFSAALDVLDSTVDQNRTVTRGGGIYFSGAGAPFNVSNSAIMWNTSPGDGGGIYADGFGTSVIRNSTISRNDAVNGGGANFANSFGSVQIIASTVVYNGSGGGVTGPASFSVRETIVAENAPQDWSGTIGSLNNSLLGSTTGTVIASGGGNLLNTVAGVSEDAFDDGGIQLSNPPVHRLAPTSRAVDALSSVAGSDQRRYWRGVNVKNNGRRFDIGAYEYDPWYQAESLFRVSARGTVSAVTVTGFQGPATNNGINLRGTRVGDQVDAIIPTPDDERPFRIRVRKGPDSGRIQIETNNPSIDGPNVFKPLGGVIDLYAASPTVAEILITPSIKFVSSRTVFRFRVVGSRTATGFQMFLDGATFR